MTCDMIEDNWNATDLMKEIQHVCVVSRGFEMTSEYSVDTGLQDDAVVDGNGAHLHMSIKAGHIDFDC